jgi:drug/metabolite transporter (DMT)-like permease
VIEPTGQAAAEPAPASPGAPGQGRRERVGPWLDFALLSVIWGSSYLFLKIGLDEGMRPLTLVAWRLAIALVVLTVALRLTRGRLPTGRRAVGTFVVLALLNASIPWILITWGAQHIPSGLAAILNALNPLFTIVIAALILHDEPITVNRAAGLLLGFVGAAVLASPNLGGMSASPDAPLVIAGEVALVVASASYAVGVVWARHRVTGRPLIVDPQTGPRPPRPLEIAAGQVLISFLLNAPLALILERPAGGFVPMPGSVEAWASIVWLGLLSTGVGFVLSFRLIRTWGATRQSLVTYVIPVVAIVLGAVVLHERLHPAELLGTVLIMSGVVLASSRVGQRRLYGRRAS